MQFIKYLLPALLTLAFIATPALASKKHSTKIYHAFELDVGLGSDDGGNGTFDWEIAGQIGTDEDKLFVLFEGARSNGNTEEAEFWALYSHAISDLWDVQVGIRHDTQPDALSHAVIGFAGLAPYEIETEAHLFVSEDSDVSLCLVHGTDVLWTQKIVSLLYVEAVLFAQDVPELDIGAGLSSAEFGVETRYEFNRNFAPYIDVGYNRKFGETSSIAKSQGDDNDTFYVTVGVQLAF